VVTELNAEVVDGVGVIAFNRPQRHNAINDSLFDLFRHQVRSYIDAPEVRCLLLRGEGKSFCSGRDTAELGRRPEGVDDFSFVRHHQRTRFEVFDSPKPVVAAVHGAALGAGFEIALSADIRIIADTAVFGLPEVALALVPDTGGTQVLPALVGPARAKYLVLTGARIDAATAYAWGIGEEMVPAEALYDRVMSVCRTLAGQPTLATAIAKSLVDQATSGPIRNGINQELLAQTALFRSDEYREIRDRRAERERP
jgi:enoyl-CoA hydratase/carnithine racemase